MHDFWALLGVLAVFTLLEGTWSVPRQALCLWRGLWGRFRSRRAWAFTRWGKGLLFPPGILVSGERFLVQDAPLAFSPDGISFRTVAPDGSMGPAVFVPLEQSAEIRCKGSRLYLDDRSLGDAGTGTAAPPE